MITVTLGTIPYPFDRAIRWLDIFLERGVICEDVFVQYGTADVSILAKYLFVEAAPIVETSLLMQRTRNSRLVISHAVQGLIRGLATQGACFIFLPRLASYKEHIDDHQLMFAEGMKEIGISYCLRLENLQEAIFNPSSSFQGKLFDLPKLADHLLQKYPA